MQYAESILDLVGDTPLVRLTPRHPRPRAGRPAAARPRQARDAQPGRLGQGPDRAADDRGGRAGRPAQAGRHDHRADVRQHRPRPRHRRRPQGLPLHLRHGRQAVGGEAGAPAGVRRRGRPLPDQRRPRVAGVATTRWRRASPATSRARSSPTSTGTWRTRTPTSARPARRSGTQTEGRITHLVASVGTGGTITGAGRYLQGAEPGDRDRRGRPRGQRPVGRHGPAVPHRGRRRGLLPGHVRPDGRRPLGARLRPRRVRDGAPDHARGGDPRRRVVRHGARGRARRSSRELMAAADGGATR